MLPAKLNFRSMRSGERSRQRRHSPDAPGAARERPGGYARLAAILLMAFDRLSTALIARE
jgi:hypothetical protein